MKNLLLIFVGLFFLVISACEREVDLTSENKATVERWLELWNKGDLTIAESILSPEFVSHIPQFPNVTEIESYKAEIVKTGTDIPDFHATLDDIIAEGDKVAGRFTATGTMKPANVKYTNTWIVLFRFAGDKIVEEWWQFDMLGVMQQMGTVPSMSEGPPAMRRSAPEDFIWGTPSEVTGDPGDPEANKALVMREFKAWNQGDLDTLMTVLDEIFATSFVYHDPARPHVSDLASYKKWAAEECITPFPDLQLPVEDIMAEGDKVVVRWAFSGTYTAFDKQVTQTGTTIYRIADGKVVEAWCACDMLGTVQQMGAIPPSE